MEEKVMEEKVMEAISATEVRRQMHRLGDLAVNGPIAILRFGKLIAVILTPAEYDRLIADAEQAAPSVAPAVET